MRIEKRISFSWMKYGEGWISLKTPGAFQDRFSVFSSYRTGMPFLAEGAEARQDFFSLKFFPRDFPSLRDISAPNRLGKTGPLSLFGFSSFACQDSRAKNMQRSARSAMCGTESKRGAALIEALFLLPYCY